MTKIPPNPDDPAAARKRIVMLAPHEPSLDPRIDWAARLAADEYDVTVHGLFCSTRPSPPSERVRGYNIDRVDLVYGRNRHYAFRILRAMIPWRIVRWPLYVVAAILVAIFLPIAMLIEGVSRVILFVAGWILTLRSLRFIVGDVTRFRPPPIRFTPRGRLLVLSNVLKYFVCVGKTFHTSVLAGDAPDLVHANDLHTLLAGVMLKDEIGCKLVYDAHEFLPYADPLALWWEVAAIRFVERRLVRRVDKAFTVNPLLAREMSRVYGVPFGSVPNCEPKDAGAASLNGTTRAASDRVRFLFQGSFAPKRGLEELVRAWKDVDPARAVLLLRGPDNAAKDEVVALAGELGLTGVSVEFPNAVLESEMIAAAAQADVGIIPYLPHWAGYRFACPNKLSQYMLAGTAILTNQLDFVVETVEHYDCGLSYDADRAQSIVAAVDRLIDDADLLDRCREHSRSAAHADFHWEKQSRPLYEAYEALTKQA